MKFITLDSYWMGREELYPPTPDQRANALDLLSRVNMIGAISQMDLVLSSGYRPEHFNEAVQGAKDSTHLSCQGIDLRDLSGKFTSWLLGHQEDLEEQGLWMEDPTDAKNHVHLQTRAAKNRVFRA